MTTTTTIDKKSGGGLSDGVVSELATFWNVLPGHDRLPPRGMEVLAKTRGGTGWRATCPSGAIAAHLLRGAHPWSDSVLDQHVR